jgi:hypothetical protein
MKILFICKNRNNIYGISFGLVNSATFVSNYLNSIGVESKVVLVTDGNGIDKEVTSYNPSHVIIEALWVTPEKLYEIISLKRHEGRQWNVRIHSKIPFLANEGIAFKWIIEYGKLFKDNYLFSLSPNTREFTDDISKILGIQTEYLPNIYFPTYKSDTVQDINKLNNIIDIGCFGAIRPMKNQLIQAVAAIEFANLINKKLRFHINSNRKEQNGDQVYHNLKALFEGTKDELVEHDWTNFKDFISLVKSMDLGLQVSLTESFNIVAADFVDNNIPIVVSPEVNWVCPLFYASPNSTESIVDKLYFAYSTKSFKTYKLNNISLYRYNKMAKRVWNRFLDI